MFYSILAALFLIKEFKILFSKLGFQKLNKIFNSQVRFFGYIIIFRSTKMLGEIADLRLCALMSLRSYVLAPLCLCTLMSVPLCPCALVSCTLLSVPLCRVSYLHLDRPNTLKILNEIIWDLPKQNDGSDDRPSSAAA